MTEVSDGQRMTEVSDGQRMTEVSDGQIHCDKFLIKSAVPSSAR